MAAAVPRAMSRWDLPVPESPIRQSGWAFRAQAQGGRVAAAAAAAAGCAAKVKAGEPLRAGDPRAADLPLGAAAVAVLALAHEQLGEEPAVGELLPPALVAGGGELAAEGGQPQHPAGGVDRRVRGFLGDAPCSGH